MAGTINVGFIDGRASSRVLKPPGGGYSDIFNFSQNEEESNSSPRKPPPMRIQTKIESIICAEQPVTEENKTMAKIEEKIEKITIASETVKKSEEQKEEKVIEIVVEEKKDDNDEKKTAQTKSPSSESTPRKGRVPPGGYSSGLW